MNSVKYGLVGGISPRSIKDNSSPSRIKTGLKNGIVPFIIMCTTMVLSIVLFRIFRAMNGTVIQEVSEVAGEETNPTVGRLIYCGLSFVLSFILVTTAHRLYKKNKDSLILPWTLAVTGGTMLWQSIGESLWHFGLTIVNDEGEASFANFPRIECMQGLPFIILTIILFFTMHKELGFAVTSWLAAFIGNWFGHIIMIGTYPIALALGYTSDMVSWYRTVGIVSSITFGITGLVLMFGNTKRETKYLASTCLFIAYGSLVYGVILGET
ncbi:MAG: hypothetical protein IKD76_07890 [Clostridia bacterium]|nr:hypothetical protein [Clostridia bacterium]